MSYTKTILCLAASDKHNGYCFAGKDIETGEWIRPVSDRQGEEISVGECTLPTGVQAELLDILEIPFLKAVPSGFQTENHLIDPNNKWKKIADGTWQQVDEALDDHSGPLWVNESASFGYSNNRVDESQAAGMDNSLILIRPSELRISEGRRGGMFNGADDRLVKAYFSHDGIDCTLAVTDPTIKNRFMAVPDHTEEMTGAVLCVSLGEVYGGNAYKLVAAVITPDMGN